MLFIHDSGAREKRKGTPAEPDHDATAPRPKAAPSRLPDAFTFTYAQGSEDMGGGRVRLNFRPNRPFILQVRRSAGLP